MSHVDDGALHAYLDGELPPVERARLEAHVAECPACRTQLEEERALLERASQLLGLAQPVERPAPPMHQLRRPRLVWRLRVPIAWAASVTLALGLGYYLRGPSVQFAPQVASREVDSAARPAAYDLRDRAVGPPPAVPQSPPAASGLAAPRAERRSADQVATRQDQPADRANAAAPAAGVASVPEAKVRPATPLPVPSAAIATYPPAADLSEARGRLVATEWPIIRPGPARELLGADPVGVPGLAVRNIRRSPTGDVVLVEQTLDSATVIQLFQQRMEDEVVTGRLYRSAAPRAAAPSRFAGTERLARFIGGVRVEIAGPLSADSLNRLLEQVKPIP
jgi:hypothetical protein